MAKKNDDLFRFLPKIDAQSPQGVLGRLKLGELKPTQNAVGMDEVNAKVTKIKEKGFTIIPTRLYINENGLAKLDIALAIDRIERPRSSAPGGDERAHAEVGEVDGAADLHHSEGHIRGAQQQ